MSSISKPEFSANFLAALILIGLKQLRALGLLKMSACEVLEATGAKKSRTYEIVGAIVARHHELEARRGRPSASARAPSEERESTLRQICQRVLRYLLEHPGAADCRTARACYNPEFEALVVQQCADHPELTVKEIAEALTLPATTVRDWTRAAKQAVERASAPDTKAKPEPPPMLLEAAEDSPIRTVIIEWFAWCGETFSGFCEHLREHHQIPFGRTTIASILKQTGLRVPVERPGRSPDEKAMRGAFESFYPGGVWTADGCELGIDFEGERFTFNLELMVDTNSGAFVGLDVRDHEDAAALISSFEEGVQATSQAPVAMLVDNKVCNHTAAVHAATGETLVTPATPARPQNKGHVEGAFGLFSQCAPLMKLDEGTARERARQCVELCTRTFFGALNMRPRKTKGGRSRIDIYADEPPSSAEIKQALAALKARHRKQLAGQETRRARQDPATRAYLDEALERLGLGDLPANARATIARYNLEDITTGVGIYARKIEKETLPKDVGPRYLGGIVRNVAREREGMALAIALWDERIKARDFILALPLALRESLAHLDRDARLVHFINEALTTPRRLVRYFWLDAVAALVLEHPPTERRSIFEGVARRIHTAYRKPHDNREGAMRVIAAKVLPLL
jgi:hypothetical protein